MHTRLPSIQFKAKYLQKTYKSLQDVLDTITIRLHPCPCSSTKSVIYSSPVQPRISYTSNKLIEKIPTNHTMKMASYFPFVALYLIGAGAVAIPEADDRCGGSIGNCYDNGCQGNPTTLVCSSVSASSHKKTSMQSNLISI